MASYTMASQQVGDGPRTSRAGNEESRSGENAQTATPDYVRGVNLRVQGSLKGI